MTRTDQKITLCKVKSNLAACRGLTRNEINLPSGTTRNFFQFVQAFGIKLKLRGFVNIWMVKDKVQDLDSATCRIFQIHFYENLFNPNEKSKIQNHAKLTKTTVETLLNELFLVDDQVANEMKMKGYADEIGVKISV